MIKSKGIHASSLKQWLRTKEKKPLSLTPDIYLIENLWNELDKYARNYNITI